MEGAGDRGVIRRRAPAGDGRDDHGMGQAGLTGAGLGEEGPDDESIKMNRLNVDSGPHSHGAQWLQTIEISTHN